MIKHRVQSKLAFGICVIIASVFSTGCATGTQRVMPVDDLNRFQIDCRIKPQQIKFLQSLRTSQDDKLGARMANVVQPWTVVTDHSNYRQRALVGNGYTDWSINQLLLRLSHDCP